MKAFKDLKPGDKIYVIEYNDDYILSIDVRYVLHIKNNNLGLLIKYQHTVAQYGIDFINSIQISKINDNIEYIDYHYKVCSDKDKVCEMLDNDKTKFMNNYNNMKSLIF